MTVDMKVWIYFMYIDAKCYILWRLTWNKTKVVNKLSRVPSTDWKSALSLSLIVSNQCNGHKLIIYIGSWWKLIIMRVVSIDFYCISLILIRFHWFSLIIIDFDCHRLMFQLKGKSILRLMEKRLAKCSIWFKLNEFKGIFNCLSPFSFDSIAFLNPLRRIFLKFAKCCILSC